MRKNTLALALIMVMLVGCTSASSTTIQEVATEPTYENITQNKIEEATTEVVTEEATTEVVTEEVTTEAVTEEATTEQITEAVTGETVVNDSFDEWGSDSGYVLTFVGDCTLGTMPKWMSHSGCFNRLIGDKYDLPFQYVRKFFEADDCTFINLESVLAESGVPENKTFTFMGPTAYVNILTGSSVEFANLSNNHSYDFGEAGYISTKNTLDNNGVAYVEAKKSTLYTTESGLVIGVYGVYFDLDYEDMLTDVNVLKEAGAEIIVAAAHWGIEGDLIHNEKQTTMAHQLIDAGVDIVWGHHPHVLQPIEKYKDGIIYYSTGNFSFGGNHNPGDRDTVVLQQKIERDGNGKAILGELRVIPCAISSVSAYNNFQPIEYAKDSESYKRVLSKIKYK